jgi:hypothetical protein
MGRHHDAPNHKPVKAASTVGFSLGLRTLSFTGLRAVAGRCREASISKVAVAAAVPRGEER